MCLVLKETYLQNYSDLVLLEKTQAGKHLPYPLQRNLEISQELPQGSACPELELDEAYKG